MLKLSDALQEGTDTLKLAKVDSPRLDAEILLAHTLKIPRAKLLINNGAMIRPAKFNTLIRKRANRIPLQHLIGEVEFFSLPFEVNKNVLIPRPETELLVEKTLEVINEDGHLVADIGTGSGCIAISIAANCDAKVYAIDKSAYALRVAKRNAINNNVTSKIKFIKGDAFEKLAELKEKFDIIVSNPPYVSQSDYRDIQHEVKYEPKIALLSGKKGIEFHQKLIENAPIYLKPGGWLMFEIGIRQAGKVKKLIEQSKKYGAVEIYKDLARIERVIKVRTNG